MGFPQPFLSALLPYTEHRGGTVYANADLLSGGRVYEEELASLTARASPDPYGSTAYRKPCAVWGDKDTVNVWAMLRCTWTPVGFVYRRWSLDSFSGAEVPSLYTRAGFYEGSREAYCDTQMCVENGRGQSAWLIGSGAVWLFGARETAVYGGPQEVDYDGTTVNRTVTESAYGLTGYAVDFARDYANDRIWFRQSTGENGLVSMFKISDYSLVATLYAANATKGIIPTGDGFVWLIDSFDWHHLYDYDGVYWGSMRNPLGVIPTGGRAYGWDVRTRRLLEVTGTASGSAGVSTIYVRGFYMQAQAAYLSKLVPRSVPMKNRTTYFFLHCYGEGGEPIASRPVGLTASVPLGITAQVAITDGDGDAVASQTPATIGTNTADATVTGRTRLRGISSVSLPQATLYVWSTTEFAASGAISVEVAGGSFTSVTYAAKTATSFTGCSGGTGTTKVNGEVVQ